MKYTKVNTKLLIAAAVCALAVACGSPTPNKNASANRTANDKATIPANAPAGAQPPNTLGSPTATVTLEEFADFQCPTCASVYPIMKNTVSAYGSRIKFTYHEFPLPMHKNGYDAAVAAEAAGMQGKFWDMQNQLFTNQKAWADSQDVRTIFEEYAGKIGLDIEKFKTDMAGLATKKRVDDDLARGHALGVNSTPTIYLNGTALELGQMTNADALKQTIDAELAKSAQQPPTAAPAAASNSNAVK